MIESLATDLEKLRGEVAKKDRVAVFLPQPALERQFHGLTLGQIVKLTDAPVLATVAELQAPDGERRERFCVDGKDAEACHAVARQLLLDPTTAIAQPHIREVRTCSDDVVQETMVRDHGVIYRVTAHELITDESLTRALQTLRRRGAYSGCNVESTLQPAAKTRDTASVSENEARILQGLADLRTCNAAARCAIAELVGSTGATNLEAAVADAEPEILQAAFRQIVASSDEIEALLDQLTTLTNDLLLQAARAPQASATPTGTDRISDARRRASNDGCDPNTILI